MSEIKDLVSNNSQPSEQKGARSQSHITLSTAISRVRSKLSSLHTLNALLTGAQNNGTFSMVSDTRPPSVTKNPIESGKKVKMAISPFSLQHHDQTFFQNNFMVQHRNDETMQKIKMFSNGQINLLQALEGLVYNLKSLGQYKSDHYCEIMIITLGDYQPKLRELKNILFSHSRASDWTLDFFMKRIIMQCTKIVNRRLQIKPGSIDNEFVSNLQELNTQLEEVVMKQQRNAYKLTENKIKEEKIKLKKKMDQVEKQFANKKEKLEHVRSFVSKGNQFKIRNLYYDLSEQISKFESKYGNFPLLRAVTRNQCSKINNLIYNLHEQEYI